MTVASITIYLVVPEVRILEYVPEGVHIVCNTGEKLDTTFEIGGVHYGFVDCDLSPGHYIDTVCHLKRL